MTIKVKWFDNVPIRYRPGTSDEKVIEEVIVKSAYRRKGIGFDVCSGEHWLDLGANIGAFALYCLIKGATADCYEPEKNCFKLLQQNVPDFKCYNSCVSDSKREKLPFHVAKKADNFSRGSLISKSSLKTAGEVVNTYIGSLGKYDGVKMDIEGAEFRIIDNDLIPQCNKLVLEYHSSRDASVEALEHRIKRLRESFRLVSYPPELDRLIDQGGSAKTFYDRFIFCMK